MRGAAIPALCFTIAAVLSVTTEAAKAYPLSSLQANAYRVEITGFRRNGVVTPAAAAPCTSAAIPSTSCPIVNAAADEVLIRYGPVDGVVLPPAANVSIFACYSNVSSYNRPWRSNSQATNVLTDRACAYRIRRNVTASVPGEVAWKPADTVPTSTLTIRAYVNNGPNSPWGFANAPQGFFQVQKIESPTHSIKSAAIGMIIAGPVFLIGGLTLDFYLQKRKKNR